MSHALLDPKVYANVGLKLLKNNLVMARLVSGEYKNEFKKIGNTIYTKRPPEFTVRDGAVASVQDVVEGEIAIAMNKQKGVDVSFTSVEETLSVDNLLKSSTMASAMATLANQIDQDIHAETRKFFNWVGTPGQLVNSFADLAKGPQRLDETGVETDGRVGVMPPADAWAMLGSLSGLQTEKIAADALTRAKLPMLGNVDWYSTQNVATITTGTRTGGAVNGASQNVTYASIKDGDWTQSLVVDGLGASKTVKAGEMFTIDGVFAVNPRTKEVLDFAQNFTVIADATANGSGAATLTVSPPMVTTGAFRTVSAAPADDAAIAWFGNATAGDTDATTYRPSCVFRKQAIALVSCKLVKPYSGQADYAVDKDTGLAIRYWRTSDGTNDTHLHRFDVLYGVKNVDPRRGTRLSGSA